MKTKHRILSVLTVLALVASLTAVMVTPAAAQTLTLTPTSGLPGTVVSVIGAGFPVSAPGTLTAPGAIAPTSFMTGAGGQIALIVTILPGAPVAAHTFNATVGVVSATATFTVTPPPAAITLSPTSGLPGTAVTATGVGFPVNAPGVLLGPPGVIAPVTFMTTAAGAIPATVVTILPGALAGAQILTATVGVVSANATFTVLAVPAPTISLSPPSGPRLTPVTVNGTGFPVNAHGIITAPGVISPVTFITTPAGALPDTNVTILGVAPFGVATITATVGAFSASAFFTVTPPPAPTVTLSPPAGARGTVVTVTGANFPATTPGVIMAPGVIAPIGFTTDAAGAIIPPTVTILGAAPFGPATMTVTVGVVSVTAGFTVHAPAVTLIPIGGVPGATVNVTGLGFPVDPPGDPVMAGTITAPGVISPAAFTTNATGGFAIGVTILPIAPVGPATFTVTVDPDGLGPLPPVTATATYTVGITPTITLAPTIGFEGTLVTVSGFGFPVLATGTITAPPGVLAPAPPFTTTGTGAFSTNRTIAVGAPVGPAIITVTVGAVTATAVFTVAGPGVPIIVPEPVVPVLKGLEVIREQLGESVWHFRAGNWYQFHTDPAKHDLIPLPRRLGELRSGEAYWIYLEKPITDVLVGGVRRTLPAGWHNIGWVL